MLACMGAADVAGEGDDPETLETNLTINTRANTTSTPARMTLLRFSAPTFNYVPAFR